MQLTSHVQIDEEGSAPGLCEAPEVPATFSTGGIFYGYLDLDSRNLFSTLANQTDLADQRLALIQSHSAFSDFGTGSLIRRLPLRVSFAGEPDALSLEADFAMSPRQIVALVRKTFALNMTQMAKVLRVERPTAYAWAALDDTIKIREQTRRQRLRQLMVIANQWSARGLLGAAAIELPLADGSTLLDLLCAENLDVDAIMAAHDHLSGRGGEIQAKGQEQTKAFADAIAASVRGFGNTTGGQ